MRSRAYRVGQSTIDIIFDDITTSNADVLVSCDDQYLTMGGGVSRAISRAAGHDLEGEAKKMVPARVGDIVVTGAGRLRSRYVFHAVTIGFDEQVVSGEAIVRQSTRKALELLDLLGCRSIAFPSIGSGAAHIPHETVAAQMATTIVSFLLDSPTPLEVELYLLDHKGRMDPADFLVQFERHVESLLGLEASTRVGESVLETPPIPIGSADSAGSDLGESKRRKSIHEMLRQLDARRDQLEASLIEKLSQPEPVVSEALKEITLQLAEIRKLREIYQTELASIGHTAFKRLLRRADLPDIRFHDLRHSTASLLLALGVNPKIVSEQLGHSTIQLTLDTYSHALPSLQADAARKLGSLLEVGP